MPRFNQSRPVHHLHASSAPLRCAVLGALAWAGACGGGSGSSASPTQAGQTVCGAASSSTVARGTLGSNFTAADLQAYCEWEDHCWEPAGDPHQGLVQSCTLESLYLPTSQECVSARDQCVAEGASDNQGTCDSASLRDVRRTCLYTVEELENCSREVLRVMAHAYDTASCDQAGHASNAFGTLSESCRAMFSSCAIWGG